jgi:PIN domain nuclease of toxin-antitoxin system
VRLLLDTHVIVWWFEGSPKLGSRARELIAEADARLYVSAASWWELAIKTSLGHLRFDFSDAREELERRDVSRIPISMSHAETAAALKQLHRDPFDRLLVAQAIDESLVLLTRDVRLKPYGSHVLCV